jgi:Coenzyme PQQ synthesis protein D (PqqD)
MDTSLLRKPEVVAYQCGTRLQQVYVRSQSVVSRRVAGETLIVPVRGKVGDLASIYSFNQTGSLIWQSMESPKTLAELIAAVQHEYDVAYEQAARDVKQFLEDTQSAGLVEVREQVSMAAMNAPGQEKGELQSAGSR